MGLELLGFGWIEVATAFGLSAAALTALYLVRRRRRAVVVPSILAFQELLAEAHRARRLSRVEAWLSLLLLLAIALLIALAMGLPREAAREGEGARLVFVLDQSASMQAQIDQGSRETRLDRARASLLARIDRLGASDEVVLLGAGAEARVLVPPTSDLAEASRLARRVAALDVPGDAREAARWARALCDDAASASRPCRIVFLTDGGLQAMAEVRAELEEAGLGVEVIGAATERTDNLAITALAARRAPADPTRAELLLELSSFADEARELVLSLSSDGALALEETLTLAPGERRRRVFRDLGDVDTLYTARISAPRRGDASAEPLDALAIDDEASALLPPRRRRRVLVVSPDGSANVYLDAVLLLDPYLDVVTLSRERYDASGAPEDRELVIFDRTTPPEAPRLPSLSLAPTGAPWLEIEAPIARPRFDVEASAHPLLAFVALRDVNIASATPIRLAQGDTRVAGESRGALLATGARDGVPWVALGLDVRESDLPMRVAWPVLVLNALSLLAPDDLSLAPSARTGVPYRLALPSGEASLTRRDAEDPPLALTSSAGAVELLLDYAGLYDLRAEPHASDPGEARVVVANLFSEQESDLRAASLVPAFQAIDEAEPPHITEREPSSQPFEGAPLHAWLVALALALLGLEWLTFHRGWTT